jgi:hypothetical protein
MMLCAHDRRKGGKNLKDNTVVRWARVFKCNGGARQNSAGRWQASELRMLIGLEKTPFHSMHAFILGGTRCMTSITAVVGLICT